MHNAAFASADRCAKNKHKQNNETKDPRFLNRNVPNSSQNTNQQQLSLKHTDTHTHTLSASSFPRIPTHKMHSPISFILRMPAPHRLSLTLKFHLFLQSGSAAAELLHFRGGWGWDMYTFFLARKVYTLSKELYSTVKKDVLSMGWGGGGGCAGRLF